VRTSQEFSNAPLEIGSARNFVSETLVGVAQEAIEDTCLMVSELATNCVRHTSSRFVVRIDQMAESLRVEVADGGGGEPVLRPIQMTEPGGRGLRIVQSLSDQWGVIPSSATSGKLVWFTLALPKPA
jgi:anti-sigma regulatory factor (Ser/Thr protein kinase)